MLGSLVLGERVQHYIDHYLEEFNSLIKKLIITRPEKSCPVIVAVFFCFTQYTHTHYKPSRMEGEYEHSRTEYKIILDLLFVFRIRSKSPKKLLVDPIAAGVRPRES